MADGATVAESHSLLIKEPQFSVVELEEEATSSSQQAEELRSLQDDGEDDDLVVYSGSTDLEKAYDISHNFESQAANHDKKCEIRIGRHEIKVDSSDEDETPSESLRLVEAAQRETVKRMMGHEEAIQSFQDVPLLQSNPESFFCNGLVFCDTVDALCRPVVVINTRAIPHKSLRSAALRHLREALEPVVNTGPYVLIFTSFVSSTLSKLPVSWIIAAYRELSYPFKKNVQYVILVRPNKMLKAFVKVMKLVVKKKAHSKVKQINYLGDIENVTNGEVTLEHLSPKVIRALGSEELANSDISANTPK